MVDTSIIIDILRKKPDSLSFLKQNPNEPLFSTEITVMELYYGIESNQIYTGNLELREKRISEISELLHHFIILPFNRNAAIKTAKIMGILKKQGNIIDFRDGMIAGISLANGISRMLTGNQKHFERISGLSIIAP
jgi:tRNA(fMet)-specific endonuclease VapC